MTRQEAVEYIQEWLKDEYALNGKDRVVLNMAIEALQQEPCEYKRTDKRTETHACDCISRQAAIEAICEDGTMFERQGQYSMTMAERKQRDTDILDALPSAQPEIIMCKDCKYLQKWRSEESAKKFGQIYACTRNVFNCPKPEDFCSFAERRAE